MLIVMLIMNWQHFKTIKTYLCEEDYSVNNMLCIEHLQEKPL